MAPGFDLTPFDLAEVYRALKQLDLGKSAGPYNLKPFFLRSVTQNLCVIFLIELFLK